MPTVHGPILAPAFQLDAHTLSRPNSAKSHHSSRPHAAIVTEAADSPYSHSHPNSKPNEQLRAREVFRYYTPPSPPRILLSLPNNSRTNSNGSALSAADPNLVVPLVQSPLPLSQSEVELGAEIVAGVLPPFPPPPSQPHVQAPIGSGNKDVLKSSDDPALTAFAQLLAIKLDCQRGMISLIDHTKQYIVAEATRTLSITDPMQLSAPAAPDGLWLGCETIPSEGGLCVNTVQIYPDPTTLQSTTSDPLAPESSKYTVLEISDLSQDERFSRRDYVVNFPKLRFYAGTPLRTKRGYNIGSLCVVDSVPRVLKEEERRMLGRMGEIVMKHLEMSKEGRALRRNQRMAEALGRFVAGIGTAQGTGVEEYGPYDPPPADEHRHEQDGRESAHDDDSASVADSISASDTPGGKHWRPCPSSTDSSYGTNSSGSGQLNRMFTRASALIRDALLADGVVFVDADPLYDTNSAAWRGSSAGHGHARRKSESHRPGLGEGKRSCGLLGWSTGVEWGVEGQDDDGEREDSLPGSMDSFHTAQSSTSAPVPETAYQSSQTELSTSSSNWGVAPSGRTIQLLLELYPQGTILSFDEPTPPATSINESSSVSHEFPLSPASPTDPNFPWTSHENQVFQEVQDFLPDCRSVLLVPLLNVTGKPYAISFAWTLDMRRVFSHDELSYLRGFTSSIMAEVSRLHTISADRAKGEFISSISHELRSPLHGVLASAEFLADTQLDSFQSSFVGTIESCGRMLLDTINHVLDFSKLGSLMREKSVGYGVGRRDSVGNEDRRKTPPPNGGLVSLIETTDISAITEQVIESVYAGYEFRGISIPGLTEPTNSMSTSVSPTTGAITLSRSTNTTLPSPSRDAGLLNNTSGESVGHSVSHSAAEVTVILDIDKRDDWCFVTQPGAVRRILMNIFGNALKYTDAGWVKVHLQAEDLPSQDVDDQKSKLTFTVSDSGRGISREFIKTRLFTPFSQEDTLASGTGLGMSIVRQIVRLLGGEIDVKSHVGIGTEVTVSLILQRPKASALPTPVESLDLEDTQALVRQLKHQTSGRTICLCGFDADTSIPPSRTYPSSRATPQETLDSLRESLTRYVKEWFGMKVIYGPLTTPNADVLLVNESADLVRHLQSNSLSNGLGVKIPLVALCSNVSRYQVYAPQADSGNIYDFASKPCGPIKLAKALKFCFEQSTGSEYFASTPLSSIIAHEARGFLPYPLLESTPSPARSSTGAIRFSPAVRSGALSSEPLIYVPGYGLCASSTGSSACPRPPFVGGARRPTLLDDVHQKQSSTSRSPLQLGHLPPSNISLRLGSLHSKPTNPDALMSSMRAMSISHQTPTPSASQSYPVFFDTEETEEPPSLPQNPDSSAAQSASIGGQSSETTSSHKPPVAMITSVPAPQPIKSAAAVPAPSEPIPNVLIVEDNPINLMLLATFLKKKKCPFAQAENGLLGVQAVQARPQNFDIILMDLQMPVMSGFEAIRVIRKLEAESAGAMKRSVIIALTGLAGSDNMQEAAEAGVDLFLTKPVSFKTVDREIKKWQTQGN